MKETWRQTNDCHQYSILRTKIPSHTVVHFHYKLWFSSTSILTTKPFHSSSIPSTLYDASKQPFRITTGQNQVQPILESTLLTMLPGDTSIVCAPFKKWVGKLPCKSTDFIWAQIILISIDEFEISREMTYVAELKSKGNQLFAREEWTQAASYYKEALRWVLKCRNMVTDQGLEGKQGTEGKEDRKKIGEETISTTTNTCNNDIDVLRLTCHLNLASCHLNNGKPNRTVSRCSRALQIDSRSVKGLVRRSKAYVQLQLYDKALDDLKTAEKIENDSKMLFSIQKKIQKCLRAKKKCHP